MPTDKYAWKMRNNSTSKPAHRSPPKTTHAKPLNAHNNDVTPRTGNNTNRTK